MSPSRGDGSAVRILISQPSPKGSVFKSDGSGGFQLGWQLIDSGRNNVTVADMNGDGHLDLIGGDDSPARLTIDLGDGDSHFFDNFSYPYFGTSALFYETADFNLDGSQCWTCWTFLNHTLD